MAVPAGLRLIIGKTEIIKSLGTSDFVEATSLVKVEAVEVDAMFAEARAKADEAVAILAQPFWTIPAGIPAYGRRLPLSKRAAYDHMHEERPTINSGWVLTRANYRLLLNRICRIPSVEIWQYLCQWAFQAVQ